MRAISVIYGLVFIGMLGWYWLGPQPQPLVLLVLALWFRSLSRETHLEARITELEKQ